MLLEEKKRQLIEDLSLIEGIEERFEYIIELGKQNPELGDKYKVETFLIEGCISNLWLYPQYQQGKCYFRTDADSLITRGIAALVSGFYSGHLPDEIVGEDANFLVQVGITQHLSPNRRNGLANLCKSIQAYAALHLEEGREGSHLS